MYPEQPFATAVAVKDGRILAVGEFEDIDLANFMLSDRDKDSILT